MRRRVYGAVLLSAILCSCSTRQALQHTAPEPEPECFVVGDTARQIVVTTSALVATGSVLAGELAGTVVDAETGKPLLAQVAILESAQSTISDSLSGHFRITLPGRTAGLLVRRIGYSRANFAIPTRADSGLMAVIALRRKAVCTETSASSRD